DYYCCSYRSGRNFIF
nr:immunoglobulin light chain junction region [Macaca mulatta]